MRRVYRVYLVETWGWRDFGIDYPTKRAAHKARDQYRRNFPFLRYAARRIMEGVR